MPASSDSARGISGTSPAFVVRGFTISMVEIAAAATTARSQKKHQMFAVGGSSGDDSLSEQVHSMEKKELPIQQKKKVTMFSFGGSSSEDESSPLPQKKQKYQEEVAKRTIKEEPPSDEDLRESDTVDESAIDDDDDDWEDSSEEIGNASIDEKNLFRRVDSRPHLASRWSLITTMLHQNDRANALATAAIASRCSSPALRRSRTTSPNGPSLAASPDSDDAPILMMKSHLKPIAEVPQSGLRPIIKTTTNTTPHQLALSPRTTRRNMLATELTVSLRQHLLLERQQKSQTANAVLKRRHTAQDVANLKQFPEKVYMKQEDQDAQNSNLNEYFGHGLGEYHSKGW